MLINADSNACPDVEFVSYTGKWPSLCHGILTLKIQGRACTFGSQDRYAPRLPDGSLPDFPKFWSTGGRCGMPPRQVETAEWQVDASLLPEHLRPFAAQIDRVFNQNTEHGCCGGCR